MGWCWRISGVTVPGFSRLFGSVLRFLSSGGRCEAHCIGRRLSGRLGLASRRYRRLVPSKARPMVRGEVD